MTWTTRQSARSTTQSGCLNADVTGTNAVDEGLMAEQAMLLRQCRRALDDLLAARPMLRAFSYGEQRGTTLGNLRSDLHEYRPQAIMGTQEE